ncbi:MAG TPA: insulinase family protein, partial [Membranihabitans sp.]|nr:insulinase family protein [Membranihabitans sp.]
MVQNTKEIQLPGIKKIEKPAPFEYHIEMVGEESTLYTIPGMQNLGLVKVEIVLNRGRFDEQKKLSSRFCARMLKEGTQTRNQDDINDVFDFFGAQFNVRYQLDYASFSLICLTKYCKELIPLVFEIISQPQFDRVELARLKKQAQSKLKLSLADNDSLSFRILTEKIFGSQHPYGYNSTVSDIDAIQIEDLLEFHERYYRKPNFKVFLSGSFNQDIQNTLLEYMHLLPEGNQESTDDVVFDALDPAGPGTYFTKNEYAFNTQSSIKMGKRIVQRHHPDYVP